MALLRSESTRKGETSLAPPMWYSRLPANEVTHCGVLLSFGLQAHPNRHRLSVHGNFGYINSRDCQAGITRRIQQWRES